MAFVVTFVLGFGLVLFAVVLLGKCVPSEEAHVSTSIY